MAKLLLRTEPEFRNISIVDAHDAQKKDYVLGETDMVILSGGTWLLDKNPGLHRRVMQKLEPLNVPIIGICLGAESIARHFGGEVERMDKRISGLIDISFRDRELMERVGENVCVYAHHAWAITSLPDDKFHILAESKSGVELFVHKHRPIAGIQFHPETRRGINDGDKVFRAVFDLLIGRWEHGHQTAD